MGSWCGLGEKVLVRVMAGKLSSALDRVWLGRAVIPWMAVS